MAEEKKAFLVYYDWEELFEALNDSEQAGELILALFAFARRGEIAEFTGALKMAFAMMSKQIGKDTEKWYDIKEKRKEAVMKRWAKKKENDTNDTNVYNCIQMHTNEYKPIQTDTNDTVNVNDNVNVNVNGNVNVNESIRGAIAPDAPNEPKQVNKKSKKFQPPTVEEVKAYCDERRNGISAEAFIDYYATRGWKLGKETMKDWKACIRTWERRQGFKPLKETDAPKEQTTEKRAYSLDAWQEQADAFDKMLEEQYGGGE